jgi:2-dehydro-3-deoxygalactonokinase
VSAAALIALDWGTTSARAYRMGAAGEVLDTRSAPLGILHVHERAFASTLAQLLGDWQDDAVPRIACGMIGSRHGWTEVPYCDAPVSPAALVEGMVRVAEANLWIVPGVRIRDAHAMPDVLRGEETQILGALDADVPLAFAVLPGTHSKWARVERGRLASFTTFMTGEVYAALLGHTILGRLVPAAHDGTFDAASFRRGVTRGLAGGALLHDAFGARTLALAGELAAEGIADWLSGLLIGHEIHAARRFAPDMAAVRIVAGDRLCARYAEACAQAGLATTTAPADAAARGLWRLATQAGLVRAVPPVAVH